MHRQKDICYYRDRSYDEIVIDITNKIWLGHNKSLFLGFSLLIRISEWLCINDDKNLIKILGEGSLPIRIGRNHTIDMPKYYSSKWNATIFLVEKLYRKTGTILGKKYKSLMNKEYDVNTK